MTKLEVFNRNNERRTFYMPDEVHSEVHEGIGTIFRNANKKTILTLSKEWSWFWWDKLEKDG